MCLFPSYYVIVLSGDIKIVGVLEDVDMIHNAQDIFDVIGDLIVDSVPECKEEDIMSVCSDLFDILKGLVTCYVAFFMCCSNLLTVTIPPNARHKERGGYDLAAIWINLYLQFDCD